MLSNMPKVSSHAKYLPFAPPNPFSILSPQPDTLGDWPTRIASMGSLSLALAAFSQWQTLTGGKRMGGQWSKSIASPPPPPPRHHGITQGHSSWQAALSHSRLSPHSGNAPHLAPSGLEVVTSPLPAVSSPGITWESKSCWFPCFLPAWL